MPRQRQHQQQLGQFKLCQTPLRLFLFWCNGLINELFKSEIIGSDLFTSLLMFCNKMNSELIIPEMLTLTAITSIYKNKGPKKTLNQIVGFFVYPKSKLF